MDVGIESTSHQTIAINFVLLCVFYSADKRETTHFHFTANAIIKKIQPNLIKWGGQGRLLLAFELDYLQMVADNLALKQQQLLLVGLIVGGISFKDVCPLPGSQHALAMLLGSVDGQS